MELCMISLGSVLIAVCAFIVIPTAVPFTLQTFGVFCVLILLGGKRGSLSIAVYLALGALGIPVFAGFNSGVGYLFGATGGYLWGFLLMAFLYWLFEKVVECRPALQAVLLWLGLCLCYLFGSLFFAFIYAKSGKPMDFTAVLTLCVLPFVLPDLLKLLLAVFIGKKLIPYLRRQGIK